MSHTHENVFLRSFPFLSNPLRALLSLLLLCLPSTAATAPPEKPGTDTLILTDGEKLIGSLQRSTGDTVVFKSNVAGLVNVTWDKIRELHAAEPFAVIPKGVKLKTNESDAKMPRGIVSVVEGSVSLVQSGGPPLEFSLDSTADLIDEQTFAHAVLRRPSWYENWRGSATFGVALVQATQRSQTYSSAVSLLRDIPGENWMDPENRTTLDFSSSFGKLSQPNTPTIKTSIFHARGERDRYFSPALFGFLSSEFNHDYSQGLDLQQTYSAGIGWSAIKTKNEQLDLRAALGYENQRFFDAVQNQRLVSSIFSESYNRNFITRRAVLHQDLSITPSWSNLHAYSAAGNATLSVPILKRISFTIGLNDTFLNNPSPNFKKNSFQASSGITYTRP